MKSVNELKSGSSPPSSSPFNEGSEVLQGMLWCQWDGLRWTRRTSVRERQTRQRIIINGQSRTRSRQDAGLSSRSIILNTESKIVKRNRILNGNKTSGSNDRRQIAYEKVAIIEFPYINCGRTR